MEDNNDDDEPTIILERGAADRLLPKDFLDIWTLRYFPVLSLTYISSVLGIAANKGDFIYYLFLDKTAYMMALTVVLWVSIPGMLWIFLKGSVRFPHVADIWFVITAVMMTATMLVSFVLLPEAGLYGMRLYFVASIPVFFVMYIFFVKGGMPPMAAHPLSALGLTFLLYGGVLSFLY